MFSSSSLSHKFKMKYAVLALFVVFYLVALPEAQGQSTYMTANQCKMIEDECPSRKGDKSCNRCCRSAGCNRGDCNGRNCRCSGCRG